MIRLKSSARRMLIARSRGRRYETLHRPPSSRNASNKIRACHKSTLHSVSLTLIARLLKSRLSERAVKLGTSNSMPRLNHLCAEEASLKRIRMVARRLLREGRCWATTTSSISTRRKDTTLLASSNKSKSQSSGSRSLGNRKVTAAGRRKDCASESRCTSRRISL